MNNTKLLKDYFTEDELNLLIDKSFTYSDKVIVINTEKASYEICCDIGNELKIFDLDNDISLDKTTLFDKLNHEKIEPVVSFELDE